MPLFVPQSELYRFKNRYMWILLLMVMALLVLIGRLYFLQVSHGDEYLALSRSNFVSVRREIALRGMIFDRRHHLLADNRPSFNLYFTPAFCRTESFDSTMARLTEYLGLSDDDIERAKTLYQQTKKLDRFLPVLIRRDISWSELVMVEQNRDLIEGVEIRPETRRGYVEGSMAAHLLGYVGEISQGELVQLRDSDYQQGDAIGKAGIEKAWEVELRGQNGYIQVVVDAKGQRVADAQAKEVLKGEPPVEPTVPGNNLILSIDFKLQELAEKRFPGREGAVVALDPNTGFILAMVSRPAYDPNVISGRINSSMWRDLVNDPDHPLLNRALQQHFPPGSTFKPFTGLAALESGALTATTKQICNGSLPFGDHVFRCWRPGGHGSIAIHDAIVRSCDVFFYRAGLKAGIDGIAETCRSFGLGDITGFDSGLEVPGLIPDTHWYQTSTATGFLPGFTLSDSVGQGDVSVTPLQMALAYAAISNGGTVYQPQVVWKIESPSGQVLTTHSPIVRGRANASAENLKTVAEGLVGVVNEPYGTAYFRRPQGVKFRVGGKTGTAQVVKQGADRGKDLPYDLRDHAWFVAFAPVDQPQIAVAVVNEHAGFGATGAAPLAMELITYYMEQVLPQEPIKDNPEAP